jgi:hypothetical protein
MWCTRPAATGIERLVAESEWAWMAVSRGVRWCTGQAITGRMHYCVQQSPSSCMRLQNLKGRTGCFILCS